jgi:hypothetical protein
MEVLLRFPVNERQALVDDKENLNFWLTLNDSNYAFILQYTSKERSRFLKIITAFTRKISDPYSHNDVVKALSI